MSAPQTFAPERIKAITSAALDMAALGTLMTWAGRAAEEFALPPTGANLSGLGFAMKWAGREIERYCGTINEAASNVGEWQR